ncbi:hypothetical protein E2C01_048925 [Portunus trituberculatus]|uniref:Uncharacterized protein n=1 Tax=Portunus trituberculatus TaxID=210409 RepID=A0A5B7GEM8_PORTR|nr:hypothetical protein [Portunus trituberculatus]
MKPHEDYFSINSKNFQWVKLQSKAFLLFPTNNLGGPVWKIISFYLGGIRISLESSPNFWKLDEAKQKIVKSWMK